MLPKSATKLAITTADLMKEGFHQFPQMGEYDYTVEQLNLVQAAQDNLQNNMENESLLGKFVVTVNDVSKNLEKQYGTSWENPFPKMAAAPEKK